MVKLVRTIHPVGQGAFYSEVFTFEDGRVFTVVYDCGSMTDKQKYLKKEINALHDQCKGKIDYLFISHFDSDHVNGINILREQDFEITKIIVPELSQPKWFSIIEFGVRDYSAWKDLMDYFEENKDRVIQISPAPLEVGQNYPNHTWLVSEMRPSGEPIYPEAKSVTAYEKWEYIPVNYTFDPQIIQNLKEDLESEGIRLCEIENNTFPLTLPGNGENARNRNTIKVINDCYRRHLQDVNAASMILYSGAAGDSVPKVSLAIKSQIGGAFTTPVLEACLYTGDATLIDDRCISLKGILQDSRTSKVHTLQLPHHGSKNNFSVASYMRYFTKLSFAFASFGIDNQYHHPSHKIILDICDNGGVFVPVAENVNNSHIHFSLVETITI